MCLSWDWNQPLTDVKMRLRYPIKHPKNAQIRNKPVIDLSVPYDPTNEEHYARKWGTNMGCVGIDSLSHFVFTPEQVPYTNSYSSWDCVEFLWMLINATWFNWHCSRLQQGAICMNNSRTFWAHRLTFLAGLTRLNVAAAVGLIGFFYGYEFCYTYVPYLRIRDPSPEGWKRSWQEGQTTYLARMVASIFPTLGYIIYKGSIKRSAFWFTAIWANSWYYEACRPYFAGTKMFYANRNWIHNDTMGKYGSLKPELDRRDDPDTMKPFSAASYQYRRSSHGLFQEDAWKNLSNDYHPLVAIGSKMPNPYFNWQKASQTYRNSPFVTHNDCWTPPTVLNGRMNSGVMDYPSTNVAE